jgi:hypothetical protein
VYFTNDTSKAQNWTLDSNSLLYVNNTLVTGSPTIFDNVYGFPDRYQYYNFAPLRCGYTVDGTLSCRSNATNKIGVFGSTYELGQNVKFGPLGINDAWGPPLTLKRDCGS